LLGRLRDVLQPQRALTVELFMKSFDVPQALVSQMRLAMSPPDLLIRPELGRDFGVEQFGRRDEAFEVGYDSAHEALKAWRG
jgi:predicted acylesterase/phospholipase RssA